jgi:organic radical activating enzyme
MEVNKNSFKSAEILYPEKLIANKKAKEMLIKNNLKPIHIQLFPTNKCNLKCSFCSCSDRDKTVELPFGDIVNFFAKYSKTIQSVTISGGGEPLMYSEFEKLLKFFVMSNIKSGLVTNALLFDDYILKFFIYLTWCRISLSSDSYDNNVFLIIKKYLQAINIDWAFSYVVGKNLDKDIETIRMFYEEYKDYITHMRIVGDILELDDRVEIVKTCLKKYNYDKIIYQSRSDYKQGAKQCYLATLKPVIAADGNIYPCCGAQYAVKNSKRDLNKLLCMGNIKDTEEIFNKQYFDTFDVCEKCYYNNYNDFIDLFFKKDLIHEEFI